MFNHSKKTKNMDACPYHGPDEICSSCTQRVFTLSRKPDEKGRRVERFGLDLE